MKYIYTEQEARDILRQAGENTPHRAQELFPLHLSASELSHPAFALPKAGEDSIFEFARSFNRVCEKEKPTEQIQKEKVELAINWALIGLYGYTEPLPPDSSLEEQSLEIKRRQENMRRWCDVLITILEEELTTQWDLLHVKPLVFKTQSEMTGSLRALSQWRLKLLGDRVTKQPIPYDVYYLDGVMPDKKTQAQIKQWEWEWNERETSLKQLLSLIALFRVTPSQEEKVKQLWEELSAARTEMIDQAVRLKIVGDNRWQGLPNLYRTALSYFTTSNYGKVFGFLDQPFTAIFPGEGAMLDKLKRRELRVLNLSKIDLMQTDLSGINLADVNLSHTMLDGTNFSGSWLVNANLADARIDNVNFSSANLNNANLSLSITQPTIPIVNLDQASCLGTNFRGRYLQKGKLDFSQVEKDGHGIKHIAQKMKILSEYIPFNPSTLATMLDSLTSPMPYHFTVDHRTICPSGLLSTYDGWVSYERFFVRYPDMISLVLNMIVKK